MDTESQDRIARIRDLNDVFRRTFSGGRMMMTSGVAELPDMVKAKALQLVASFDDFTEDNDPHGEHDFGSFELVNRKLFWKIDYYDERCEFGSEDPSDSKRTTRVLTLMQAEKIVEGVRRAPVRLHTSLLGVLGFVEGRGDGFKLPPDHIDRSHITPAWFKELLPEIAALAAKIEARLPRHENGQLCAIDKQPLGRDHVERVASILGVVADRNAHLDAAKDAVKEATARLQRGVRSRSRGGQPKMDQRAGGHRWPFDGSKCLARGMTPTRFADTKEACSGQPLEREGFTVPDDDE